MNEEIAISVKDVTKTYRLYERHSDRVKETFHPFRKKYHHPFYALKDISFQVKRGDTVGIIGRNGSGKSTLLQIICGILQPTLGNAEVKGRISALLELGAGFNPEFTGRQNVFMNCSILGLTSDETEERFDDIMKFADIGDFIDQPVKTYSSGMYVRLAFAIAINVDPDILIIDEALSVGDTLFQSKCFANFKKFQEKGVTILFVTHALDLITRYCNNAFLLEQGTILAQGHSKDIVDEYNRLIVDCEQKTPGYKTECVEKQKVSKTIQWKGLFHINPNENRYGNGKAEIIEGGIFSLDGSAQQTLMQGQVYEFKLKTRFHDSIWSPILACTIKDVKGFDISGTNTLYQNIDTGKVHAGDVLLSTFRQKMVLNAGGYLLSFGCAGYENGEYVVYERRYEYLSFEIISRRSSVGIFDMDSEVSVARL